MECATGVNVFDMKYTNKRPLLVLKVAEYTLKNNDWPGTSFLVSLRSPLLSFKEMKSTTEKAKAVSTYDLPWNGIYYLPLT